MTSPSVKQHSQSSHIGSVVKSGIGTGPFTLSSLSVKCLDHDPLPFHVANVVRYGEHDALAALLDT
jgi:hypothetical protein